MSTRNFGAATTIVAALLCATLVSCFKKDNDTVDYSFVVVGGCRVDKADTNTTLNPSGANVAELDRTLEDVAQLDPKPAYVFFAGDMIYGYEPDTAKLGRMFAAWRDHVQQSPVVKAGIKVVAVTGNHEMQDTDRKSFAGAEMAWEREMSPFIYGDNGPHAGGLDSLTTDQSKLTYSFNYKDAHFIVLNTDPVGQDSHIPAHWVADDITAARKAGAKHIFPIGHKPAFAPDGGTEGLTFGNRSDLWQSLENNHVEAMLASHVHVFWPFQPHHAKTWMLVGGNGGTQLEKNLPPNKQYFGFTLVTVMKSGRVIVKSYGRDVPKEGYAAVAASSKYPTTVRDSLDVTWKD